MKIDNSTPGEQLRSLERSNKSGKPQAATGADARALTNSTLAHLHTVRAEHQDVDAARVQEVREAIKEGRLEIRTENIADGLIRSLHSMLTGKN